MDRSRQIQILNPSQVNKPVHVIGVGATGGWVALMLAKMGIQDIRLYDYDTVEEHNIPNQIYRICDIGKKKIDACYEIISKSANDEIQQIRVFDVKLTDENIADYVQEGYVLCFVDSIDARRQIFEGISFKSDIKCFIETRIGTDIFRVYAIDTMMLSQTDAFLDSLPDEDNTEESFCGTPQTIIGTAFMAAGAAVWKFIEIANAKNRTPKDMCNEIICDVKQFQAITTKFE